MTKDLKWHEKFTYHIVSSVEHFYYILGYTVATHPFRTIGICWLLVALSALGFVRFYHEKNPLKLWVPQDSKFLEDTNWLMNRFQNGFRMERFIFEAEDILTPEVLLQLLEVDRSIKELVSKDELAFEDICFKVPDVGLDLLEMFGFMSNNSSKQYDPSATYNSATYCKFLDNFEKNCFQKNLLQLWNFEERKLRQATKQDIVNRVNKFKSDPIYGELKNYEQLLGGVTTNETGHIVAASALITYYAVYINFSSIDMDKSGNIAGTADWASEDVLNWESEFDEFFAHLSNNIDSNYSVYHASARSFGDITAASMFQEWDILFTGIGLMIIYVQFVISRFNCVEAKIALGGFGLLSIGLAFLSACGICCLMGVPYGPVHTSLPFLLMGLGVDDMFVITACWEQLLPEKNAPLPEKIAHMMQHAGVSITVTTFTDVVAFFIGASTILPCLESFCIYAAVGVLFTLIFVVTFFTACFTLDQKRQMDNRNGTLFCYKHKDFTPNKCSQVNYTNKIFNAVYSKLILTLPGKIVVLIITLVCLGVGIMGTLKLEQRFNPDWMVPSDNYLSAFLEKSLKFFPEMGFEGGLYLGSLNYTHELQNIHKMAIKLENSHQYIKNNQSWVGPFRDYVKRHFRKDVYTEILSTQEFNLFLSKFLYSPKGARFQANFRFSSTLECGIPAPNITMSIINFQLHQFSGPETHLPAMHHLNNIAKESNFTTGDKFVTAWSTIFATWVTDELIETEVVRNLQLALLCVMICTMLLVANIQTCVWIFVCVLLTMIDVCGFMQIWGITINMVSCIGLELGIGLCVDYATHIGHTFLTIDEGSRKDRSLKTVSSIGSAVLYGGISTFIGVSMLGLSRAYTFQMFFKIFFLVVLFGIFHGVVLLPVIFSWIGPQPYKIHKIVKQDEVENVEIKQI